MSPIVPPTTLIIGGCRSGKSRQALNLAEQVEGSHKLFLATCIPHDEEMFSRIQRHQEDRGKHWRTVECPTDLVDTIAAHGHKANVILIDCLTLWISNLMLAHDEDAVIMQHIEQLTKAITQAPCPIIAVSNEVGSGIVPENALARRFRDLAGWCNQAMAAACSQVTWMVAGIAVNIKETP